MIEHIIMLVLGVISVFVCIRVLVSGNLCYDWEYLLIIVGAVIGAGVIVGSVLSMIGALA